MFPQEKQKLVINWEGTDYEIGEFNVSVTRGKVRVSAADQYTILKQDSSALRTEDGRREPGQLEIFKWRLGRDGDATYEYTVLSPLLPEHRGWLMHRTDTMPRREPRMWDRDGQELPSGVVRLEELAAANLAETRAARTAAAGAGGVWSRSSSHQDAAGVAYPRRHAMAVPDNQLLLTFRSALEAETFWKWVGEHGWNMFGDRDELL